MEPIADDEEMDIPVAGAAPGAPARNDNTRRELIGVGVAAVPLLAAVTVAFGFVALIDRSNEFSFFAPFGEWQLYAMEMAIGVVVLGVGGFALVRLVRQYRGLRDRTPHRRVMLLVALLPGLSLGSVAVTPMRVALSWASHQTAAWSGAQHKVLSWTVDTRSVPDAMPLKFPAAIGPTAAALLSAADFGTAWSPTLMHAPTGAFVSERMSQWGVTAAAWMVLSQRHRGGQTSVPDPTLYESAYAFTGQDAATRYLAREWPRQEATCGCSTSPKGKRAGRQDRPTARLVGGSTVWEYETSGVYGSRRAAAFAVGSVAVMLTIDARSGDPSVEAFDAVVAKAVAHATLA